MLTHGQKRQLDDALGWERAGILAPFWDLPL